MNRFGRWLRGLLVLMIASGFASGALAASETAGEVRIGALIQANPDGGRQDFSFTPGANGEYAAYLFPADENDVQIEAALYLDGEEIAVCAPMDGGGRRLDAGRLIAGEEYILSLSGEGSARLEVARETLSRSFGMPLELDDGESYSKLIARAGDVHWYSVKVSMPGAALLACVPEDAGLRMQTELFSADGRRLAVSETLTSGAAMLSAAFGEGERLFIRVSGSAAGKYDLQCLRSENSLRAQSVQLSAEELTIDGFATGLLQARAYPETACELVYLDSSAPRTAMVWPSGYVEGRTAGSAVVTAYAYGGARSSCRVTVNEVPVQGAAFSAEKLTLTEGESRSLIAAPVPPNATQRQLAYASADESVAAVDRNGVVTAVSPGETQITVTTQNGQSDVMEITVRAARPRYRALLIGEQNYAPGVESVRDGSEKSVQSLRSMLNAVSLDGGGYYSVETRMDVSRDEALAAVRETFADAKEADTSLVYITCHGYYRAGMTFFLMVDGSVLSAADLERELKQIPGKIVLLVDCCGSGGLIGEAGGADDLLSGVTNVFQGAKGAPSVSGSKYRVIASAYLDQDSYRIGFGENGMSTVFARALCDAAGWNMDRGAPSALNADVNYDGRITLAELEDYLAKRVTWYLNLAGSYVQSVSVYPKEDPAVVFGRVNE